MAARRQPPNAAAAGDDPPAAAGRDGSIEQALARSREIRNKGYRQMQAAWAPTPTMRRSGPGVMSGSVAQDSAAGLISVDEEIERTRQARARLAAVAGDLAQTEENVACVHERMARRGSPRAAQHLRAAGHARQAARRAREIQRGLLLTASDARP